MLFNSWPYVLFLIITLLFFWNVPSKFRIPLLLVVSYVFYMCWNPPFGLIYGPFILLDSFYMWLLSCGMVKWPHLKKNFLIFGLVSELTLLAVFKYSKFVVDNVEAILRQLGYTVAHWDINIFLPLAISFTTFILIAYLIDVYRGDETPDPSFIRFATYVGFFPHLIAGPIVRASELLKQFDEAPHKFQAPVFVSGIHKFIYGLSIKIFVADLIAPYVNAIFNDPTSHQFFASWVATYGFAIQIFCDFAGYTLMAQGSALMLGYTLPENFNAPYFSKNITDFWRRWHMSLSRWLRDYLYIPLGGSRCSKFRTYVNLFLTMGLGGLWHGASWNFVIWGLLQGAYLTAHKGFQAVGITRWIPAPLAMLITFHVTCIAWVFFRANTFEQAISMLRAMVNPAQAGQLSYEGWMVLGVVLLFLSGHGVIRWLGRRQWAPSLVTVTQGVAYFVLIYLGITLTTNPQEFIYFQF